ncbi:hypothetical protein KSX_85470 [Ktedonospora formicarum]|uniref:Uncharacterized protein n=1 Tax=Ktedonospora formicarum TaxID=2778364 RepID=A0A8J3I6B6_9CHLR|nr:hypothetical protein [Ktedonospora formicarum]GHO50384.1 hypothetical protein KSX_85470 [Ktedonospora formicarum]
MGDTSVHPGKSHARFLAIGTPFVLATVTSRGSLEGGNLLAQCLGILEGPSIRKRCQHFYPQVNANGFAWGWS